MTRWPRLDLIVPVHHRDATHLSRFLQSLHTQTYPKDCIRLHVLTEGNSEEAKALGMQRSAGEIIGLFCADNVFLEPDFLEVLVDAASQAWVTGAYTSHYAYVPTDTALSRYFALLGANDPLCWWLGKADRQSHPRGGATETRRLSGQTPSLGDNGFFVKASLVRQVGVSPATFGSPMCFCEDLRKRGFSTYRVVSTHATWHRTGESLWSYLGKRYRYVDRLYFAKRAIRRWHLVGSLWDWGGVLSFALCSVLVVPQVFVSLWGVRRVKDVAWVYHPLICFALTFLYTWLFLRSRWSFRRSIVKRS